MTNLMQPIIDPLLIKALKLYPDNQDNIAIEELAELISALTHYKRGKNERTDVISEIVDVKIMIRYLELKFGLTQNENDRLMELKIERLRVKLNVVE